MRVPAYDLNDILKDRVTGFEGQCLGVTFYDTDCIHYGLCPRMLSKDGTPPDWKWFDQERLTLVRHASKKESVSDERQSSGPDMNPQRY